jgi:hypothetical protein
VRSNHITRVRAATTELLSAIDKLTALKKESDSLDLGNAFTTDDFEGDNSHLATADIIAITGTSLPAIDAFIEANYHYTNMYKVRS